jgi:hypothetical protein
VDRSSVQAAPSIGKERVQRATENVYDTDGSLCVDKTNRVVIPSKDRNCCLTGMQTRRHFRLLSFTNKEYVMWIITPKRRNRKQRLKQAMEKLVSGKRIIE